jgi:putative transposase
MARPIRLEVPGEHYHITARGNRGELIFRDDRDKDKFLEILSRVIDKFSWSSLAYCLMSNHFHLVVQISEPNLSEGMRQLNGVYAQYFNRAHDTAGHMFQGRFKSIIVADDSHLVEAIRYVALNPVRAKMVKFPEEYQYSSFAACAGYGGRTDVVNVKAVAGLFSRNVKTGMAAFGEFVESKRADESPFAKLKHGWILGGDEFIARIIKGLEDIDLSKEHPLMSRNASKKTLTDIFPKQITNKKERDRLIAIAYLEHRHSMKSIADYLGLHYATISRAINKMS